jgi:tRNA1Val (adenine37-N6)-methyltransferase
MSNSYFQFKQFLVKQERSAMKVSTDACIQGAWTPITEKVKQVLDIGTGTGLLSLMLAQRKQNLTIDAIELDEYAFTEAKENVAVSPWSNRINIINCDAREYAFNNKYDMIICNPPFFKDSLLSDDKNRNLARHNLSLSFEELYDILRNVLKDNGYASIMLPPAEHNGWENLLQRNGWSVFCRLFVQPRQELQPNRIISLCTTTSVKKQPDEALLIYEKENVYTEQFIKLLNPFYLNL